MDIIKHVYCKKVKINLTKTQKETIDFWFRKCTYVYNTALQQKIYYYQSTGKYLNVYEQKKELVGIKEFDYTFKDVPNKPLQEIIFRLDKSFKDFFHGKGFPKYKRNLDSLEFVKTDVRLLDNNIYIPKIKTPIKCTESINPGWTSVRLKKDYHNYYLIFIYDQNIEIKPNNNEVIGVDLGLKNLYVDSNGKECPRLNQKLIKKYHQRLKILNQSLSIKTKGSVRFKKVKKHLNKTYQRLKNTNTDYLHKKSLELVKSKESIISVGDIGIQSIVDKNKNNYTKKGLIKSFYTSALGTFKYMITYKGIKFNKIIKLVNERNTSKTCSCCGWINYDLKLSDRVFVCKECGNSIDRDYNSAINMKRLGSSKVIDSDLRSTFFVLNI